MSQLYYVIVTIIRVKWTSLLRVGDDEWNFTYLIHSRNDRSNIVPTLGFEPWTSYMLGGCLTYCAISNEIFQKKSVTELFRLWKLQGARVKIRLNYCRDMPKIEEKKRIPRMVNFRKFQEVMVKSKGVNFKKLISSTWGVQLFSGKSHWQSWRVYQEV